MKFNHSLLLVALLCICLFPAYGISQAPENIESDALATEANAANAKSWIPVFWNHKRSCACTTCDMQRSWEAGYSFGSVEYLMMWSKPRSVPALVTTSDPGDAGVLGASTTETLFGGDQGGQLRNGGLITAGRWLGANADLGLGVRLMAVESNSPEFSESATFGIGSSGRLLARPFLDATASSGIETALPIAQSGLADGSVTALSRNDLMTGELFLRREAWDGRGFEVEFLMGYHVTQLDDLIDVSSSSVVTGAGGPFGIGTTVDASDQFEARNSFHGGSLGLSADFHRGNIHFKALGKVSLGNMNQQVMINGSNTVTPGGGAATTTAGGLLAQATNIGDYERNEFVYVPEIMMTVGYDWRENIQLTAGYSFTYWSRICLAGDQIDRRVNTSQLNGGALVGNALPEFSFQDTDFWLQGIRLGFNWAY